MGSQLNNGVFFLKKKQAQTLSQPIAVQGAVLVELRG